MWHKFQRVRSARLRCGIPRCAKSPVRGRKGKESEKRAFPSRFPRRSKTIACGHTSAPYDFNIPAFTTDDKIGALSPCENSAPAQSAVVIKGRENEY